MPAMTPEDLHRFLEEHFPQAADHDLKIEHLDDTTIRVRLPTKEQHLRPGGTISGPTLVWLADLSFYLLIEAHAMFEQPAVHGFGVRLTPGNVGKHPGERGRG